MYQPPYHREERSEVLEAFIERRPLGLLISHGASGLQANLLPMLLQRADQDQLRLTLHMARANPQWRDLQASSGCLVVFQGPQAYVSPSWYPSKMAHGKVVPTWNYIVVQAKGSAQIIDDTEWLRRQVEAITNHQEASRADPWAVDDAPDRFIDGMLKAIVGLEIAVHELEGKWKISQNRNEADLRGVVQGLGASEDVGARTLASAMQP